MRASSSTRTRRRPPARSAWTTTAGSCSPAARGSRTPACGTCPGGFLGEDEHPLDALRRELLEETGLEVEPAEWFGAFLVPYGDGPGTRTVLNLVWRARVVGGTPCAADDVSELGWFARDELPPLREIAMAEPLERWLEERRATRLLRRGRAALDRALRLRADHGGGGAPSLKRTIVGIDWTP